MELVNEALSASGPSRYFYVAPYRIQAKGVAWDRLKAVVSPLITSGAAAVNETELRIDFAHNGARITLFGADNAHAMRGLVHDGGVIDEYAQVKPGVWETIVRPTLVTRQGWALFIGTPMGKDQFWELWDHAGKDDEEWARFMFKASETGVLSPEHLERERAGMSQAQYDQEYECSFEAAIEGAYYGELMSQAQAQGRITSVPYEPKALVHTCWDLGYDDATAIWFLQIVGREVRAIDYYEARQQPLSHYAQIIQNRGYAYDRHVLPHDIKVTELQTGESRYRTLASLGVRGEVCPQAPVEDGINAVRNLLPKMWFDERRCERGLECLRRYRAKYDEKLGVGGRPVHDEWSHGADALRYGALTLKTDTPKRSRWTKPKTPVRYGS